MPLKGSLRRLFERRMLVGDRKPRSIGPRRETIIPLCSIILPEIGGIRISLIL